MFVNEWRIVTISRWIKVSDTDDGDLDLASILTESFVWLAQKLGPLLSAKFVTDRLLRHMKDCYNGRSPLTQLSDGETLEIPIAVSRLPHSIPYNVTELDHKLFSILTSGDTQLLPVIHCLEEIAFIYGEQYILLHYIPYISHMVNHPHSPQLFHP